MTSSSQPARSISQLRPFALAAILLGLVAFAPATHSELPTVILPAYGVSLSVLNVPVWVEYENTPRGAIVHKAYVGAVKSPSIARSAGLKQDMEIIAIQHTAVAGLSQIAFTTLLDQPGQEFVVLLVRQSWFRAPVEVHLRVPR